MNVAIIPARGGSKRIPRKNIKHFNGKPIIAYSIEAALQSGCFDRVIVSTDDSEIAEVAKQYGAEVPFKRPANIADDYATTLMVIEHALNVLALDGVQYQHCCCIYATAPFVTAKQLKQGLQQMQQRQADYLFPVCEFPAPIQRAIRLDDNANVAMFAPEHLNTRSQDLSAAYYDTGQFYWGTVAAYLSSKPIYSEKASGLVLPKGCVVDIDTPEDWLLAEALFSFYQQRSMS
ncbi:pseudaminic acid cytidylyltransferase [Shewanella sp. 10N.261.52.F9]|uniref:pseudaminic acid cytidylyltransferase n=1 Tax=Shewanella sp. 10N.261.52.F9 TaxID=3229684 RepID=UPI00354D2C54